jgi:hypothetical protein
MNDPTPTTITTEAELEQLEREEQEATRAARGSQQLKRIELLKVKKAARAKYGKEGEDFAIVETPAGFFVVHKVPGVVYKQLRKSEMTDPDVEDFVRQHLDPLDHDRFVKCITDYDATLNTVFLAACANLHGAQLEARAKK